MKAWKGRIIHWQELLLLRPLEIRVTKFSRNLKRDILHFALPLGAQVTKIAEVFGLILTSSITELFRSSFWGLARARVRFPLASSCGSVEAWL